MSKNFTAWDESNIHELYALIDNIIHDGEIQELEETNPKHLIADETHYWNIGEAK